MSNHNQAVPSWLDAGFMERNLQRGLNEPTLQVKSIDITKGSEVGDNFVSLVLRIVVKTINGDKLDTLSTIVKIHVKTTLTTMMTNFFETEGSYYTLLHENLNNSIKKISNLREFAPRCYFVDPQNLTICLEDLNIKGFLMKNKIPFLNLKQAELVVDALATLHGTSYQLFKAHPEHRNIFNRAAWKKEPEKLYEMLTKSAYLSVKKNMDLYCLKEKYRNKLLSLMTDIEAGLLGVCDFREENLNFLIHGDCWRNNIMFRYENGIATEVKLVDFQLINYNSFAYDFHYFLFTSVEVDIIVNKLDHILERYHDKLREIAPNIPGLSFERIKKEFYDWMFLGYSLTIMFRPRLLAKDVLDLDAILLDRGVDHSGFTNPEYKDNLQKLMPFFEKHGLLE